MHYRLYTNIHHFKIRRKQDAQPIGVKYPQKKPIGVKNVTAGLPSSILALDSSGQWKPHQP
jgi:hypothetical protein